MLRKALFSAIAMTMAVSGVLSSSNAAGASTWSDLFGGGQTATSSYGPTVTTSGNSPTFRVGNGGTFIYRVTASDPNGVDRIDLYVNNVRIKTCTDSVCEFQTTYYTNGQTSRTIPMSARATDKLGYSTDLPRLDYLTVDQSSVTATMLNSSNTGGTQTTSGISAWTWLDPNQTSLASNATMSFNVGAWNANGLSRIDIVVNGVTRRTCNYATAYGNQTCSYTLYGGDYAVGTTASMNALVTGSDGKTTWTALSNVYVTSANGSTSNPAPSNANTNTSVWTWSSPETANLATTVNATVQFSVGANDPDGISKIEMYVNGYVWNTCNLGTAYGNQGCNVNLNGSSFAVGTDVFVNAKVTDAYGNTTWTGSRTYHVVAGTTTTPSTGNQTANWIWSSPDVSSLSMNQSATFNIGAWDANGLNRTEIWVNGQLKKTCSFGNVVGNRDCSFAINANDYPAGTSVFVNAMMVDANGVTTWSASRSYAITTSSYTTQTTNFPGNLPGWVSVTSNRDGGYTNNQLITYTATANDQNGLDRIELYVNGTLVKTCYNTSSCSWTGGYYNSRNYVNYGATIVDKAGFALWTGYKTIAKK